MSRRMRKPAIVVALAVVAIAAVAFQFRGQIAMQVMQRGLERNMAQDFVAALPDGLNVALCGAGAPLPDPERSGPCVAVVAGRSLFVVDAGSGGARNLLRMDFPMGRIKAVFLTHFHSDHIDGLGELAMLRWTAGANQAPLPVYGPAGVEEVVAGFNRAYRLDAGYRTAHHGAAVAPPDGAGMKAIAFDVPADGSQMKVWDADDVRVTAFRVDHAPVEPSVGYRFDYGGRSVVVSGDTKKSDAVARAAVGADLLLHEALSPQLVAIINRAATNAGQGNIAKITHDIPDYHTTPVEAAQIAAASGVSALMYYHIVPPLPLPGLETVFTDGVDKVYGGKVVVGRDGTLASMPRGSKTVEFSRVK